MLKLAVLLSGYGSHLGNFLAQAPDWPGQIVGVFSNVSTAHGLLRARHAGVPIACIPHHTHASRAAYDAMVAEILNFWDPDYAILAGYMRILSPTFLSLFRKPVINIHPSLLPAYPGTHTHHRVLAAHERRHGATVHQVNAELDAGPILGQAALTVLPTDTPETLRTRVLALEHRLYPDVIRALDARGLPALIQHPLDPPSYTP